MMLPDFRVRQRDYLLEITRALNQELDLDKLLDRILVISIELLAGQGGLIALRDKSGAWRIAVSHDIQPAFLKLIEPWLAQIPYNEDPAKFEVPEISRLFEQLTYTASLGFLTGVGLPLIDRQHVIGLIYIFRNYTGGFSANDRIVLSTFADQAAVAVRNAQLYTQLSQEKQRADALLDSAGDGILILGPDHKIERANPAFGRMIGLKPSRIQNQTHDDIIRWSGKPQGMTLETAEAGGWPLTRLAQLYVEGDLQRGEQPPLPVGITYAPLISPEGTLLNIIATVRDITRFRQAEELKSTFISIISHELKTPIALIKGYVGTLRREDASWDSEIVKDSLKIIEEESDHLAGLIEDMLDASRLQAGGFTLRRSDVSLVDVAHHVAERFQTQTSRHQIVVDMPDNLPVIFGDETRLRQVLSNLVSNAIKYATGGEIRISAQERPDQIIVSVSDQGPGIAIADIPHVFDRFYRSPDMSRHTKGTGLGLYLARSIIEAHGGSIWVEPNIKEGAKISFSLPRLQD